MQQQTVKTANNSSCNNLFHCQGPWPKNHHKCAVPGWLSLHVLQGFHPESQQSCLLNGWNLTSKQVPKVDVVNGVTFPPSCLKLLGVKIGIWCCCYRPISKALSKKINFHWRYSVVICCPVEIVVFPSSFDWSSSMKLRSASCKDRSNLGCAPARKSQYWTLPGFTQGRHLWSLNSTPSRYDLNCLNISSLG